MALSMSKISGCDVTDCSYNMDKQCRTMAITVGDSSCAMCDTYTKMSQKGGSPDIIGGVGACKESDCKFNQSLECSAGSIHVASTADMQTAPPTRRGNSVQPRHSTVSAR